MAIDLRVGGRRQRLNFDTGSGDLAVEADGYDGVHSHPGYSPGPGARLVNCSERGCATQKCYNEEGPFYGACMISDSYGDGSNFDAVVYEDAVGLWDEGATVRRHIGAILRSAGGPGQDSFEPFEVNGIIGTAFGEISETDPWLFRNPILDLASAAGLPSIFSICYADDGGMLGVGEIIPYYSSPFDFEPLRLDDKGQGYGGFWSVSVLDIIVLGQRLPVSSEVYTQAEAIVDTGTTVMLVPTIVFDSIQARFKESCDGPNPLVGICVDSEGTPIEDDSSTIFGGQCANMTKADAMKLPVVHVRMNETTVAVDPASYLFEEEPDIWCAFIGPGDEFILGDGFLRGLTTVFDADKMQVGFAKVSGCPGPLPQEVEAQSISSAVYV